jgi:hypothetical protein
MSLFRPKSLFMCAVAALILTPMLCRCEPGDDATDIETLRTTLLKPAEGGAHGSRVREKDPRYQALGELAGIGSAEAAGVLQEFLTTYGANRYLKQRAYAALGQIGTEEAVKAIGEFEQWSQTVNPAPPDFQFGPRDHAIDHFNPNNLKSLVKTEDEDGNQWALFQWKRFGTLSLWIVHALAEDTWSQPVLLDLPDLPAGLKGMGPRLSVDGETFTLSAGDFQTQFNLKDQLLDTDADGLPDNVERLLETDPKDPDTDGDGVADGKDMNPLTPTHKEAGDEVEIRQAVFSALFATCNSRNAIVLVGDKDFTKQEYSGYGGFVLRSPTARRGFVNVMGLKAKIESPTTATASVSDWEGNMAGSGHRAKLKKIHGKWVVIEFRTTWIK